MCMRLTTDAQVLAERLVARSEFHAASVDFLFELVYQVAVVDDLLRELSVVVLERPDGLLHGLGRHAAHAVDHIFQGREVLLQPFSRVYRSHFLRPAPIFHKSVKP